MVILGIENLNGTIEINGAVAKINGTVVESNYEHSNETFLFTSESVSEGEVLSLNIKTTIYVSEGHPDKVST